MKIIISLLIALVTASAAAAQIKTFKWQDELCNYSGTYDAKKFTPAQLQNTWKLARPSDFNFETNTTVWKYADIAQLDVAALDLEYQRKSAQLKALDIVNVPYWQEMRRRKLREFEQVYKLNRTTMLAYKTPSVLTAYGDAPACYTKFGEPIIKGGDSMLNAWLLVNEESRRNNADPARLKRIYEQQLRSPERMQYALLEVMAFGWSNCANDLIDYVVYDETPQKEFKKLFTSVKTRGCDEP